MGETLKDLRLKGWELSSVALSCLYALQLFLSTHIYFDILSLTSFCHLSLVQTMNATCQTTSLFPKLAKFWLNFESPYKALYNILPSGPKLEVSLGNFSSQLLKKNILLGFLLRYSESLVHCLKNKKKMI